MSVPFPFLADNVQMTVNAAPGTGPIVLNAAVPGHQSFTSANVPNGATIFYLAQDVSNVWEIGTGVYTSSNTTLSRNPILGSSGANTVVNLSSAAIISLTVSVETLNNVNQGGLDNPFHNAGCNIAQRGTGSIAVSTASAYTLDGWAIQPSGSSVTVTQAAGIGSSLHSIQITGATGNTQVAIVRRVESFIAAPFAGQTAILQFKINNNSGASITPSVSFSSPATQDVFTSTLSAAATTTNTQACPNGATTLCAIAVTLSASITTGLQVAINLGALASSSDTVQISEIDMSLAPNATVGLIASPPSARLARIDEDLRFCQRYFHAPGITLDVQGAPNSGGNLFLVYSLPVVMRASPTIVASWTTVDGGSAEAFSVSSDKRTLTSSIAQSGAGGGLGVALLTSFSAEL
jgi:hypothetical protein